MTFDKLFGVLSPQWMGINWSIVIEKERGEIKKAFPKGVVKYLVVE